MDTTTILDRRQLRDVALNDKAVMQEIVTALIDDTSRQMQLLETAICEEDSQKTMRLAHYTRGALSLVGANAAVQALKRMEREAERRDFRECSASLISLSTAIDQLRSETVVI
jgi:HPt (histidine-containing phosphotransfer) domain-containing protein